MTQKCQHIDDLNGHLCQDIDDPLYYLKIYDTLKSCKKIKGGIR